LKPKSLRSPEHVRLMEWLRAARKSAGRSQQYVAQRLGRTQSFVSKYERGERRLDVVEVVRIARVLECDAALAVRALAGDARRCAQPSASTSNQVAVKSGSRTSSPLLRSL
jgi:transcriptional regulator with XRE-family HTH domain